MRIIIRKLQNMEHRYFAYLRGMSGKATYLLYFEDNIYGAVSLHNFIEMLKNHFKKQQAKVFIHDKEIEIKNQALLDTIAGEWTKMTEVETKRILTKYESFRLKDKIREKLLGTRIVCSNFNTESFDDMGTILAGVDAGLAFYKPVYTTPYNGKNLKYVGLSSGKISTYLRYGIPILTNNIGKYADIIKTNKLGFVLEHPDKLGSVLEIFKTSEYTDRCKIYFLNILKNS